MGEIRIAELEEKININDSDLIVIEDDIDTKKSSILNFKRNLSGDYDDPSRNKFYSSQMVDTILRNMQVQMSATTDYRVDDIRNQLNNLLTTTSKTPLPVGSVQFDLEKGKEKTYADWFGGTWECIGNVDTYVGGTYNENTGDYINGKTVNFYLYKKIEGIDYPDSALTNELIAARGEYGSLGERLAAERAISDTKYMQYPLVETDTDSLEVINKGSDIEVSLLFKNKATKNFNINKRSANLFNKAICNTDDSGVNIDDTGVSFYMKSSGKTSFRIRIDEFPLPGGVYYMYQRSEFANGADAFTFDIMYTDGSYDTISPRMNFNIIEFNARKQFNYIKFNLTGVFDSTPVNDYTKYMLKLSGLMIAKYSNLGTYSSYLNENVQHAAQEQSGDVRYCYICNHDMVFSSEEDFTGSYVDTSYNTSSLIDMIKDVDDNVKQATDHCGLMEDYGTYIYLNDLSIKDESVAKLTRDKSMVRNSNVCSEVTIKDYNTESKPTFIKSLSAITSFEEVNYVTLQLYIDRTLFSNFYTNDGISIIISSDKSTTDPVNYYVYNIGKGNFVQGWNNIKVKLSKFSKVGSPDISSIRQIRLTITTNNFTAGHKLWFSSIILNQRMKPTVLLAFDGTYDTAFNYQYPLLYSNNIPATVFINDRNTWNKDYMNNICNLIYQYGWDIGDYGCNPDKELLIEDDNPREQYLALKSAKEYLTENYLENPISYSASFGNLRPITVPILKSLGFKIAKAESNSMCSFFSKHEFTMPMYLLSNVTTSSNIIDKIDEAVETGQCIVIYTNNVTEYGDEIAASKTSFENVLNHIIDLTQNDKIQCLTFRDFYNKCVNE